MHEAEALVQVSRRCVVGESEPCHTIIVARCQTAHRGPRHPPRGEPAHHRWALIVIDAQQEYFEGLLPIRHPARDASLARIAEAMDAAEEAGIPVVVVQHEAGAGSPVFAPESSTFELHPEVATRAASAAHRITKSLASVFAGTGLEAWLREHEVDTITIVGYMTNNCVIGSAAAAEPLGFAVEVLSDATGAIDIVNAAGSAPARQVHETLMAVLHSSWAAVATTSDWTAAVRAEKPLAGDNLIESASRGESAARGREA